MIDKLKKLFNTDKIIYDDINQLYLINKKISIVIYTPESYSKKLHVLKQYCYQRKNCWIMKPKTDNIHLYFNLTYIQTYIRQQSINSLLND